MTKSRLEKLRNRRIDPLIKVSESREVYRRLTDEDSAVQYVVGAMQPIDPDYTSRTLEERKRVEEQLDKGYKGVNLAVDFEYQGSVTNDTHIRAHSDVDLLTVESRWFAIQPPNKPAIPYQGDPVQDLRQLRIQGVKILKTAFPAATVDESGSKAINISGGSLRRKIDVIACAWWHTVEFFAEKKKHALGVEILDNDKGGRISNKPFLHNRRIEDRDAAMNGGLRKLIRLLKSLKYDSDDRIELSSYDIAGIAYNTPDDWLSSRGGHDLILLKNCQNFLHHLLQNPVNRNSLEVPNGTRKVFCAEGASETGLRQLSQAVDVLTQEVEHGLNKSFKKLAEARVLY